MITKKYRQKETLVTNAPMTCRISVGGSVVIESKDNYSQVNSIYSVEVRADELLKTAKLCLQQLEKISGVHYGCFAKVGSSDWVLM